MQININTDKTIERNRGLDDHVQSVVDAAIGRFGEHITRVEAHLSNENSEKLADGGSRCMLEARVTGYQPIAVSDHSPTLHQAISGAADKLKAAVSAPEFAASGKDAAAMGIPFTVNFVTCE